MKRISSFAIQFCLLVAMMAVGVAALPPFSDGSEPLSWCPQGDSCQVVPVGPASNPAELAVAIHEATTSPAVGTIFVNPGGPGQSSIAELNLLVAALPPSVQQSENIAAFDERGTGSSGLLICGPSVANVAAASPLPEDHRTAMAGTPTFAALGNACAKNATGVDTWTSAGDLNQIRQALGLRRIGIYGLSYGSVLALTYAARFPSSATSIVLDGTVDPQLSLLGQTLAQAPGLKAALSDWINQCSATTSCAWHPSSQTAFNHLAASLARSPLPLVGQPAVTDGDLLSATLLTLSLPSFFSASFEQALQSAADGDGSALRTLSTALLSDLDGASTVPALWATQCQDSSSRLSSRQAGVLARVLARSNAIGAEAITNNIAGCINWPVASHPLDHLRLSTKVPTLIIESSHDPNTPLAEARLVALRTGASVITSNKAGHTWLFNNGYSGIFSSGSPDSCVDGALSAFIMTPVNNKLGSTHIEARC